MCAWVAVDPIGCARIDAAIAANAESSADSSNSSNSFAHTSSMRSLASDLARCLVVSSWDAVNEAIGDEAVRAFVNWLGCALIACRDAYVDPIADDAAQASKQARVTLLGHDDRLGLTAVAAVNAACVEALAYTETHAPTGLRPSAVVAGALLPLAESIGCSGERFMHAFALGIEVSCRAASACGMTPHASSRRHAALAEALGVAAACTKLLQLDAPSAAHALEAACMASDATVLAGTAAERAGQTARIGLVAALHAREDDRERRPPALSQPAPSDAAFRSEALLARWADEWHSTRLAYHPYPCAHFVHPVIEACLQLKRAHHLSARRIAAVAVHVHPSHAARNTGADPDSSFAARHSLQHAASVALVNGAADLAQFERPQLRSPRMKEMRSRVEIIADEALSDTAARVCITLPEGGTLARVVRCPLGHPLRPLEDHDLSDKFRVLAAEMLASSQVERLLGLAWNVRALPDMVGLVRTTIAEDVHEPDELPGSPLLPR